MKHNWARVGLAFLAVAAGGATTVRLATGTERAPAAADGPSPAEVPFVPRRSSSPTTTTSAASHEIVLESVVEGVGPQTIPGMAPAPEALTPAEPAGSLSAGGVSMFATKPDGRLAYGGQAVDGEGLRVQSVTDTGFWVGDATDQVFVSYGEAGRPSLRAGQHVALRGLVRVVSDDFDDPSMSGAERASLTRQQIYVYALSIDT